MKILQITPGAGGMYCGNCFRDNALVGEWGRMGHEAVMIPLYLPMTLDEEDRSREQPVFFGGISVYLEQIFPWMGRLPRWVHRGLASPMLLKLAAGRAAKTRASDVGDLALSMLEGEEGRQAAELSALVDWLKERGSPDVVSLSNALLLGLARRIRAETGAAVVCNLQGEDSFLDALPEPSRARCWKTLADRARDVDLWLAPSRYYGELMQRRVGLAPERVRVVHNGMDLAGFEPATSPDDPPVLGYFARMCREKGLDVLVDAFIRVRQRGRVPGLRLRVGGGCGPSDVPVVEAAKRALEKAGLLGDVSFFPNVDKAGKQAFFRGLSLFSVPALYGEAFGLYLLEAWASGVPVVQPRHAAFPELVEGTGAGVISGTGGAAELSEGIEALLLDRPRREAMARRARQVMEERFTLRAVSASIAGVFEEARALRGRG